MKHILYINEYKTNKSYLYHTTSSFSIKSILDSDVLKKSDLYNNVSFTRDKNFWYRGIRRAFRLVFDKELLKRDYKIYVYDFYNDKNRLDNGNIFGNQKNYEPKSSLNRKAPFEYEEYIKSDIKNISKYLVAIEINNGSVINSDIKKCLDKYLSDNPNVEIKKVDEESLINYYVSYIKESISNNNYYYLFDELVYVDDMERYGDEVMVYYTKSDGSEHKYRADYSDLKYDFVETDDSFNSPFKIEKDEINKDIKKDDSKKKKYYDIVYYVNGKKYETLKRGIETSDFAYSLKNTLSKDDRYKNGIIRVDSYESY